MWRHQASRGPHAAHCQLNLQAPGSVIQCRLEARLSPLRRLMDLGAASAAGSSAAALPPSSSAAIGSALPRRSCRFCFRAFPPPSLLASALVSASGSSAATAAADASAASGLPRADERGPSRERSRRRDLSFLGAFSERSRSLDLPRLLWPFFSRAGTSACGTRTKTGGASEPKNHLQPRVLCAEEC